MRFGYGAKMPLHFRDIEVFMVMGCILDIENPNSL
jgi:hypothetical protein